MDLRKITVLTRYVKKSVNCACVYTVGIDFGSILALAVFTHCAIL